jgi:hypothetical protein
MVHCRHLIRSGSSLGQRLVNWDELVYRVTMLVVILALVWLFVAPMPDHQPLVQFTHQVLVS